MHKAKSGENIEEELDEEDWEEERYPYVRWHDPDVFKCVFLQKQIPCAIVMEPYILHDRLALQQGVFLVPGRLSLGTMGNLAANGNRTLEQHLHKLLLALPRVERDRALYDLQRMNISHASLFPGLDGYTRSLRTRVLLDQFSGVKWEVLGDELDGAEGDSPLGSDA